MRIGIDMSLFTVGHTGGREVVAFHLLRGFREMGQENNIICFCLEEYVDIIKKYGDFKIVIVPYKRVWSSGARLIDKVKREIEAGIIGTNKVGCFLKKEAIKEKLDVLLFADKATPCMKFPIKTAFITHDSSDFSALEIKELAEYSRKYRLMLNRWWFRADVKYRDLTIAISDFDLNTINKYIPNSAKKAVRIYDPIEFGNPVDVKRQRRKHILGLNIAAHHKNVITLVKAFCEIAEQVSWDLMLVGKKPMDDPELYRYIESSPFKDQIIFTGFVSNEMLGDLIEETAVYVNPSLYEGFGMAPIEMMGRNIQTIVANCTASAETTMGLCRYYYPPQNHRALAEELLKLAKEPMDEEEILEIAAMVRRQYSYKKIAEEYWSALEKLISK